MPDTGFPDTPAPPDQEFTYDPVSAPPPPRTRRPPGGALGHARWRSSAPRTVLSPARSRRFSPGGPGTGFPLDAGGRRGRKDPSCPPRHAGDVLAPGGLGEASPNSSKHSPARRRGNARPLLGDPATVVNPVPVVTHPGGAPHGAGGDLAELWHPDCRGGGGESRERRDEGSAQEIEMGRPSHACGQLRLRHPSRGHLG